MVSVKLTKSARLFQKYQNKLYAKKPTAKQAADQAAKALVDCRFALADQIWPVLWTKPLYTNRDTDVGQVFVDRASDDMQEVWAKRNDERMFYLERRSKEEWISRNGTKNEDFMNVSPLVRKFQTYYSIPYQRSYSMLGALRHLKAVHDQDPAAPPFAALATMELRKALALLHKQLGWGWAQVTASHFLTDLGLACKPDRHVMRTLRAIGLTSITSDNPSPDEVVQIVQILRQFLPYAYGNDTPGDFRHMDKSLMEISRTSGILP